MSNIDGVYIILCLAVAWLCSLQFLNWFKKHRDAMSEACLNQQLESSLRKIETCYRKTRALCFLMEKEAKELRTEIREQKEWIEIIQESNNHVLQLYEGIIPRLNAIEDSPNFKFNMEHFQE